MAQHRAFFLIPTLVGLFKFIGVLAVLFGYSSLWSATVDPSNPYPLPDGSMNFFIEDNGIFVRGPVFRFDVSRSTQIRVGEVVFDPNQVRMELRRVGQIEPVTNEYRYLQLFGFYWPLGLVPSGKISVRRFDGGLIFESDYSAAGLQKWKGQLKQLASGKPLDGDYKGVSLRQAGDLFRTANFGFFGDQTTLDKMSKPFQFCVDHQAENGRAEICSPWLIYHAGVIQQNFLVRSLENEDGTIFQTRDPGRISNLRVLVDEIEMDRSGDIDIPHDIEKRIQVESPQGFRIRYRGKVLKAEFRELVQTAGRLVIQGRDHAPFGGEYYKTVPKILRKTLWLDSINTQRSEWTLWLPKGTRSFAAGDFNQLLSYYLDYSTVPEEQFRPRLIDKRPRATYSEKIVTKVRSDDSRTMLMDSEGQELPRLSDNEYLWKLENLKRNEWTEVELRVRGVEGNYKAHYRVYRAPSTDVSLRAQGLLTETFNYGMFAEGHVNKWFEDIVDLQSPRWSYQRWGAGFRYSQTVLGIPTFYEDGSKILTQMRLINLDLKYRLKPGVWGLQEAFGPMLSLQNMRIDDFQDDLLGVGAYWSKSFPKIFSQMVDWIPIFNYPKWVDAEFIYYAMPLRENLVLKPSFNLNFHGKINWSPRFFGDLGFGIKRYQVRDIREINESALVYFYGAIGGGISF